MSQNYSQEEIDKLVMKTVLDFINAEVEFDDSDILEALPITKKMTVIDRKLFARRIGEILDEICDEFPDDTPIPMGTGDDSVLSDESESESDSGSDVSYDE